MSLLWRAARDDYKELSELAFEPDEREGFEHWVKVFADLVASIQVAAAPRVSRVNYLAITREVAGRSDRPTLRSPSRGKYPKGFYRMSGSIGAPQGGQPSQAAVQAAAASAIQAGQPAPNFNPNFNPATNTASNPAIAAQLAKDQAQWQANPQSQQQVGPQLPPQMQQLYRAQIAAGIPVGQGMIQGTPVQAGQYVQTFPGQPNPYAATNGIVSAFGKCTSSTSVVNLSRPSSWT